MILIPQYHCLHSPQHATYKILNPLLLVIVPLSEMLKGRFCHLLIQTHSSTYENYGCGLVTVGCDYRVHYGTTFQTCGCALLCIIMKLSPMYRTNGMTEYFRMLDMYFCLHFCNTLRFTMKHISFPQSLLTHLLNHPFRDIALCTSLQSPFLHSFCDLS